MLSGGLQPGPPAWLFRLVVCSSPVNFSSQTFVLGIHWCPSGQSPKRLVWGFVSHVTAYLTCFHSTSKEQGCRKATIYRGPGHAQLPPASAWADCANHTQGLLGSQPRRCSGLGLSQAPPGQRETGCVSS